MDISGHHGEQPRESPAHPAAIFRPTKRAFITRYGTALLVLVSVATGAYLQRLATRWWPQQNPPSPTTSAEPMRTRLQHPVTLNGPGGPVTLPLSEPVLVHVWTEGCQECLFAFEAMKTLKQNNALDHEFVVVNVAYGSASPAIAAEYGLDERLVFDPSGHALVRPLGIATFASVIIDPQGYVRLRDRPDNAGYADRIAGASRVLRAVGP